MKVKKGDNVKMMAGKDRGKTGKVLRVYPDRKKVVVEGLNLLTKHQRARSEKEKGQKIHFPRAVSSSIVRVICTKCGVPARIGAKRLESGKNARMCKKCKELIE